MIVQRFLHRSSKFSTLLARGSNNGGGAVCRPIFALQNNQNLMIQPSAFISTSKKKSDPTISVEQSTSIPVPKTVEDFAKADKRNWQSYGYHDFDRDLDINIRNHVMFFSVTVGLVGIGFIMTYTPSVRMKDWTLREAYIEIARREALGLPYIDENLVPADQIVLPTEEELGDYEIII